MARCCPFCSIICKLSQLELYTVLAHLQTLGRLSSYTNRAGWLFLLWFTNMPLRSTDQQLAFWVLCFSAWCAVSLRISVQTASLWQRARWVASDTTSQTTHQTNTLKALSTLTLYHLICVIRAFIDVSTILQLAINHYSAEVVTLHSYVLWCALLPLQNNNASYLP